MAMIFLILVIATCMSEVRMRHDHVGPPNMDPHAPEFRYKSEEDFSNDLKDWIKSRPSTHTIDNIIETVFSRLGVYEKAYCGQKPGEQSIAEAFKNTSAAYNITHLLSNEREMYRFFNRILAVALHVEPCFSPHIRLEKGLYKAEEHMRKKTMPQIFELVKRRYNRHAFLAGIHGNDRLIYDVEAYANRFMCVDETSLLSTVNINPGHNMVVDEDWKRNIQSTALVLYILKGYNLLGNDEMCPGAYLHDIYKHYSGRDNQMSEHELTQLVHALKDQPQHVAQTDREPSHVHHQRDLKLETEKEERFLPDFDHPRPDVHNNFHEPHDQDSFDQGYRYSAPQVLPPPDPEARFLNYDIHLRVSESHLRQCFDSRRLLDIFTGRPPPPHDNIPNIPMSLFMDMCPALLHKTLFKPCHRSPHAQHPPHRPQHLSTTIPTSSTHSVSTSSSSISGVTANTTTSNNTVTEEKMPRYKSYLFGSLAVLVISLCSIVGAGFMKVSRVDVKTYIMGSMLSLAVGCLVADAALHLLPEIVMSEEDMDSEELVPDYLRKLCAFLASIYVFFILELLLSIRHDHSHTVNMGTEQIKTISLECRKDGNIINETNLIMNNGSMKAHIPKTLNIDHEDNTSMASNHIAHQTDDSIQVPEPRLSSANEQHIASRAEPGGQVLEPSCSNASDRISIHDAKSGVKALAWMIIIGDGIHNFADGLAIGAAFALTFTKGISTSITVLCHELPHELGDFAVLVSTGMSIKKAMFLNFVSSLTAFAGLYVGLALGEQEEASQWIFAVGAGMFLYVALTDLVPECKEYFKTKCTIKMFLGQNVGLLLGYVAMLLIAMYEDKLEIKE